MAWPKTAPFQLSAISAVAGAAVIGTIVGVGSVATTSQGQATLAVLAKYVGVKTGMVRRRLPKAGDHWPGCNDARAAGTAPIYRGEPGYHDEMDGDGDGIACEPQRH